jgi:hypothetical protein
MLNQGPEEMGEYVRTLAFYCERFDVRACIYFNWFLRVVGFWAKFYVTSLCSGILYFIRHEVFQQ